MEQTDRAQKSVVPTLGYDLCETVKHVATHAVAHMSCHLALGRPRGREESGIHSYASLVQYGHVSLLFIKVGWIGSQNGRKMLRRMVGWISSSGATHEERGRLMKQRLQRCLEIRPMLDRTVQVKQRKAHLMNSKATWPYCTRLAYDWIPDSSRPRGRPRARWHDTRTTA